jgi:hypothetical protein
MLSKEKITKVQMSNKTMKLMKVILQIKMIKENKNENIYTTNLY